MDAVHSASETPASETDVELGKNHNEEGPTDDSIPKQLTLTFRDVTVKVKASEEALGPTLLSHVDPRQFLAPFQGAKHPSRVGLEFRLRQAPGFAANAVLEHPSCCLGSNCAG